MNDLILGLVLGYLAGTAGMFLTFYFARLAGGAESAVEKAVESITASGGIRAPRV
ncbi:MAG TPA: hypothetical protein RMH85_27275 [Polyangiaceae bacterium LLY-WYZ-15_(1-7)]|nr:hypothetical protein [Polyangiaceae bacterium LLY-WYZ-15_(1-7)]HJL04148.1 hypothetical protein [Polyangiaceae bacterium LLY-WYZ-15_(1-7)]HJL12210.1 hypothetical protein [Polyangiaceae bacterium LLY-WYZ-15_(1-7)]HJL23928.1 hypothetical protein [Polyangiaceae bacterium LLY-WYZ-15_(1-7)]HJL32096.1 hypothetical protein [Polyangiaceae bacterium LLY-WYZ-15_(1-7)]